MVLDRLKKYWPFVSVVEYYKLLDEMEHYREGYFRQMSHIARADKRLREILEQEKAGDKNAK